MAKRGEGRYSLVMTKRAACAIVDDRQQVLPIDLPLAPPMFSDRRAREEILFMIETLEAAKAPPWSWRLLGWQKRRFATMVQLMTPIDAASMTARFDGELARLGDPPDED